jgi:ornithine cyclodeaminase
MFHECRGLDATQVAIRRAAPFDALAIHELILSREDLIGLLPPREIIAAVEAAARAQDESDVHSPPRHHFEWDDNTLLTMPAVSGDSLGVKLVSVVPGNSGRELPVIDGLMVLMERKSGKILALMNAAALTALRTGAMGAVCVEYTTPAQISSAGIIGCGVQGAWQAIFACAVRPIRKIFCLCRSTASLERFAALVRSHAPAISLQPCQNARDLLANSELVITATNSAEPVLPDETALLEGKHFISIGSFKSAMQELPDAVYRLARELIIDSDAARHEVGDVINAVRKGLVTDANVFNIAQLIAGKRSIDVTRTTVCKSVGLALYDLYVANVLYVEARRRGVGSKVKI